jgi:serine/threonine protein kinase
MSPELYQRVRKVFDEAIELPEHDRLNFVKQFSGEDTETYDAVVRLLKARVQASPIDETPHLKRIGRYLITGELGRGGMGVVYDAIDPKIDRAVAVKVIHLESLGDSQQADFLRDRLFREARSAGRLSHPGIVTIFDADQEGQLAFLAMERVEGSSLHRILAEGRELSYPQIFEILRQTAAALDYAHSRNVVHCDVKPENLMIGAGWTVKLTDFGIAKITSTEYHTRTGFLMGTPSYMSPEQIEGRALDGRSDQFSLAALAFRLLAGTTPFQGDSLVAMGYAIVSGPRPSAAALNPRLPAGVDQALVRGLAKSPEERFPTCSEFVSALEAAVASEPPPLNRPAVRNPSIARPVPDGRGSDGPVRAKRAPHQATAVREQFSAPYELTDGSQAASPARTKSRAMIVSLFAVGLMLVALVWAGYRSLARAHPTPAVVTLPLNPPPPSPPLALPDVELFTAEPSSIKAGSTATLHWRVTGAAKVTIDPAIGAVEASGTITVSPKATTLYRLTASGPEGEIRTGMVEVTVDDGSKVSTIFAKAVGERQAGHPETAFLLFHQAADLGDARSMLELGNMLMDGEGVGRSYDEAARWYRKAADRGSLNAMLAMGGLYYMGQGVPMDFTAAAQWFTWASDRGDASAKFDLCQIYEEGGHGLPKDLDRARRFCQDAAALGNEEARKHLPQLSPPGR